ncbi:MAG: DNA topoisomerase I [Eggerthellaceae bacterium]|nr:DNA topoisomerase I [Eggerthellaceae bacterium]
MKLVVTEKNDAAKQIAELLSERKPTSDKVYSTPIYRFSVAGEEWVTIGLRGHILEVDFPEEYKRWKMASLPALVYAPVEKLPKEKDIIRSLKNLAAKANDIVIATDFDREGELIGSDALACIRQANTWAPVTRARYSSFTKKEITESFANLAELDENLAQAGESRQDIDLIWGAVLNRYLTMVKFSGYGNVRSSGRVQTPTLALIVAREREREAFVPEDYWVVKGSFGSGKDAFEAPHATARFKSAEEADAVMAAVAGATQARVTSVERKRRSVPVPAPFNTTSLMAAAASEGITPARTMRIAESLYMRGLISYPRVDNTVYPASLDLRECVRELSGNPAYAETCRGLLARPKLTASRGKQQTTDHPPIYPTACATSDSLSAQDWKLYNLIARRFLATLSDAAVVEGTTVGLDVAGEPFVAKGDVLIKAGFRAIYPFGLKKDDELPALAEGDIIAFNGATCTAKQTEPPARYTQGKLVQEMEKLGLGTKSTRASIIERLYDVKYIANDPIEPSRLGMAVCDALATFAPRITGSEMTAELEHEMDQIASGQTSREAVVGTSRDLLAEQLSVLMPAADKVRAALEEAVAADSYVGKCPKCGRDLQMKTSSYGSGSFIGCSGWPECDVTYPLPKGKIEVVEEPCPACGKPQVKVTAFRAKPKTVCIDPLCPTNAEADVEVGACPVCAAAGRDSRLVARRNPKTLKRSIQCENYDTCGTRYPLPQNGKLTPTDEVCPDCGAPIVVVTTARGPWKLCPNFDCPSKAEAAQKKAARATGRKSSAKAASKTTKAAKAGSAAAKTGAKTAAKATAKKSASGTTRKAAGAKGTEQ